MNVGEIDCISFLGLPKFKLSREIRSLVIHRKVVINGETRSVFVSVGINPQLPEGIRVGDDTCLVVTEVALGD